MLAKQLGLLAPEPAAVRITAEFADAIKQPILSQRAFCL